MSDAIRARSGSFQFLLLHPEFRRMVYHELLSRRSLLVRDRIRIQCFEPLSRDLCLTYKDGDEIIALLRSCKHVLHELQPLLKEYSPSRLIVSRDVERLWSKWSSSWLLRSNLPSDHIVRLDFDVKCLGEYKAPLHVCPGNHPYFRHTDLSGVTEPFVTMNADQSWCGGTLSESLQDNTEVQRLPDLGGIHRFTQIFASFSALRELHISNVLRSFLEASTYPCTCSVAGTNTCICGQCFCHCPIPAQLPFSQAQSMLETQASLWGVLYTHFQYALPLVSSRPSAHSLSSPNGYGSNNISDHDVVLGLLARDVHIFFHEELAINISLESQSAGQDQTLRSLHKGTWRARFHLTPPGSAKVPLEVSADPTETLQQRAIRTNGERYECQATAYRSIVPGNLAARSIMSDLRTIPRRPIAHRTSGSKQQHERPLPRTLSKGLDGRHLTDFESELELKITDEHKFNSIVETETRQRYKDKSGRKFGKLRD